MPRRSSGPWFRMSKNAWYVCHEGKRTPLGGKGKDNEDRAVKAWHRFMAGDALVKHEPMPCQESASPFLVKGTLPAFVQAFLSEAEPRVKPESYRGYAK